MGWKFDLTVTREIIYIIAQSRENFELIIRGLNAFFFIFEAYHAFAALTTPIMLNQRKLSL